eukprot:gene56452-54094_t
MPLLLVAVACIGGLRPGDSPPPFPQPCIGGLRPGDSPP